MGVGDTACGEGPRDESQRGWPRDGEQWQSMNEHLSHLPQPGGDPPPPAIHPTAFTKRSVLWDPRWGWGVGGVASPVMRPHTQGTAEPMIPHAQGL